MLKVVVDATPLLPKPSGVGFYIFNLLESLYKLQHQIRFELEQGRIKFIGKANEVVDCYLDSLKSEVAHIL